MNERSKPTQKKTGVMRFQFPYGREDWDFAYITLFYIKKMWVSRLILESNTEKLKQLEHFGVMKLCSDTQKARISKLEISVNPTQVLFFIKAADELSNLMTQSEGLVFTTELLKHLLTKHKRFRTAKDLESFYLPYSTGFIKIFKENYKDSEDLLKKVWG